MHTVIDVSNTSGDIIEALTLFLLLPTRLSPTTSEGILIHRLRYALSAVFSHLLAARNHLPPKTSGNVTSTISTSNSGTGAAIFRHAPTAKLFSIAKIFLANI